MSLRSAFDTMKRGGYIVRPWEEYSLSVQDKDNDRAFNVNAPSQIGACPRSRYFARIGMPGERVSARSQRIFDNGSYVHLRIQHDLREAGILVMDEIPVFSKPFKIQGHTDGLLNLTRNGSDDEFGILEIKSINSRNFAELKGAKEEHRCQGLIYQFCIEERRLYLHDRYKTSLEFALSQKARKKYFSSMFQHLKSGRKHSREEKIAFQVGLHVELDKILYSVNKPISKVIFLYENKDTQEIKEFCVNADSEESRALLKGILHECVAVNKAVEMKMPPARPSGARKGTSFCRWCSYQDECFIG